MKEASYLERKTEQTASSRIEGTVSVGLSRIAQSLSLEQGTRTGMYRAKDCLTKERNSHHGPAA